MDKALRVQILRAAVRDRAFLTQAWRDVNPEDFPQREEVVVARAAVTFFEKYGSPIGPMLRSEADDIAAEMRFGEESKKRLHLLCADLVKPTQDLVSVRALVDRVRTLKKAAFFDKALEEITTSYEEDKLSAEVLAEIVEKAQKELRHTKLHARDYFTGLEDRQKRRKMTPEEARPCFLIGPLDKRISGPSRGELAIWLAPPSGGKGLALVHMSLAYAMQDWKVLHISLEDSATLVEDRMDACLTGLPLRSLKHLPNRLRKRYDRMLRYVKGSIRLVDGTEGGWTVSRVQRVWEELAQEGFVADVIVIDYDDELECEKQFKGDSARRFEFAEIYRRLRKLAATTNTIVWTAAQTSSKAEGKRQIVGKDIAEDYSKIRKVYLCISIGGTAEAPDEKYLFVVKNRTGRRNFGVTIATNYGAATFYDIEATARLKKSEVRNGKAA